MGRCRGRDRGREGGVEPLLGAGRTPPYHVYLKALYELYHDELGAPELELKKSGAPELANFQLDAVRRGLRMIDQHGGCFIGDVVGLGKTYIGAELVRQLQFSEPAGRHPLIICPAGLKSMWERSTSGSDSARPSCPCPLSAAAARTPI